MKKLHFMIWFVKKDGTEDWDYVQAANRYEAIRKVTSIEDFDHITDVTEIHPEDGDDSYLSWT